MTERMQTHAIRLIVFMVTLILTGVALYHPAVLVFDETHYVPAASGLLHFNDNRNPEHPLFAKEMIAAGMWLFGETPFGWRALGVLVSACGILACFEIARTVFKSTRYALFTCAMILLNIIFVVQARLAMLDTYTYPLLAISAAFLMFSAGKTRTRPMAISGLILAGIFLGLAAGSKWIAGIYAAIALILLIIARTNTTILSRRPIYDALIGRGFDSWPKLSMLSAGLIVGIVSLSVYFLTFLPYFFWPDEAFTSIGDLIDFQFRMYELQTMPLAENSYESEWWEWPLLLEPIWYHFETLENGNHEAIFYVGNPAIFWGGTLALLGAVYQAVRRPNIRQISVISFFLASWLIFAILPKQVGFLFYYHGSAMLLAFVIASAIQGLPDGRFKTGLFWGSLAVALSLFVFFLPVIYAMEMPPTQWLIYIWMPGWT